MQRLTGFTINRTLKRVSVARNGTVAACAKQKNKVTLAVHQLKMACLLGTRRLLYIRLTMTEEPNSDHLFPPQNV